MGRQVHSRARPKAARNGSQCHDRCRIGGCRHRLTADDATALTAAARQPGVAGQDKVGPFRVYLNGAQVKRLNPGRKDFAQKVLCFIGVPMVWHVGRPPCPGSHGIAKPRHRVNCPTRPKRCMLAHGGHDAER